MKRGKAICRTLKAIRQKVADANGISYKPCECHHRGDCLGTCPACEAEVKYLEQQLDLRHRLGKAAVIIGVAASLLATPVYGQNKKATKNVATKKATKSTRADADVVIGSTGGVPSNDTQTKARAFNIPYRAGQGNDENKVYDVVEEIPHFPGGNAALMKYLETEVKYPEEAKIKKVQGRVIVTFVVEKDGRITNGKVARSLDPLLDTEALRLVGKMPRWTPGKQDGKAVRVKYIIPVTFRLP